MRAVVFDLGKVLVDFDYSIAARKLAEDAAATPAEVRKVIDQSPLLFRYEAAGMTTAEFFRETAQQIGYRGTFERFAAAFADIFSEIPEMVQVQTRLQAASVPTYVLSNTNEIAITHIRRNFPFFSNFSGHVLSYEHGVLKPERGIYEVAEKLSGCRGEEILFIDDRLENVEGAAAVGWRIIHHRDCAGTIRGIEALVS